MSGFSSGNLCGFKTGCWRDANLILLAVEAPDLGLVLFLLVLIATRASENIDIDLQLADIDRVATEERGEVLPLGHD